MCGGFADSASFAAALTKAVSTTEQSYYDYLQDQYAGAYACAYFDVSVHTFYVREHASCVRFEGGEGS